MCVQKIETPVFPQKDKAKENTREGRISTQRKRQMTSKRQESEWRKEAQEGTMDPPLSQIARCQHQRDWDWAQREEADDFKQTGK